MTDILDISNIWISKCNMSHLEESAFGLTAAELEQIQYLEVLKRRRKQANSAGNRKKCFSDKLSVEAQIAMQLALEDTQSLAEAARNSISGPVTSNAGHVTSDSGHVTADYSKSDTLSIQTSSTGSGKNSQIHFYPQDTSDHSPHTFAPSTFSQLYHRNNSARMRKDITDENYSEERESRRALGGGKVESAMEIIDIIQHDEEGMVTDCTAVDDEAISELARINAMEKCEVWMEATVLHRLEPDLDPK